MARSEYVYLALWSGVPFGAFTVKRELRGYLERMQAGPLSTVIPERLNGFTVYRMPDGGGEGTEMSIPDILAGK